MKIEKKYRNKMAKTTTKKLPMTRKDWENESNIAYEKKNLVKQFQKRMKGNKDIQEIEQHWVDTYLQPIIDFFGDEDVWKTIVPNVELYGLKNKMTATRNIKITGQPQAHYSSTHWTSRLPNEKKWFNPYDKYQIKGTNQFCQTFALMNLCHELPPDAPRPEYNSWTKYYYYTEKALEFMQKTVGKHFPKNKDILTKIKECRKHSYRCVNCIEILTFE